MREKFVIQKDKYDCGLAALKTIFLNFGKNIKIDTLNNDRCLSAYELIKISKRNGLIAKGVKADLSNITKDCLPCISHIIKDNSYFHYIVIMKNNKKSNTLIIFDPAEGKKTITYNEFKKITTNIFIIFKNKKNRKIRNKRFNNMLIFLFKKNIFYIFCSIILSLLLICLSLIFSFYSKFIFVFKDYFIKISIVFWLLSFLKNIILFFNNKLIIKINEQIDEEINNNLISHLFKLPCSYYQKKSTGYLMTTINDIENFKNIIIKIFVMLFVDSFCLFIIILSIFFINSYYFVSLFILLSIKILFSYLYSSKYNNNYLNFKKCKINCSSKFINIIENIISVKNLFLEEKIVRFLKNSEKKILIEKENFNRFNNTYIFINYLLEDFWFILIIVLLFFINIESFELENLIIFIGVYQLFLKFLNNVCNFIVMHKTYISSVQNVLDIMDEKEESKIIDKKLNINEKTFNINKNDFIFIEGKRNVKKIPSVELDLKDVDKFTRIITLNKTNQKRLKYYLLKNNIVYVSNKQNLFIDTIFNNLKIVNNKEEEINKVINVCGLEKLLQKNSRNYIVDNTLSGSEKSRILIARALLTNAKAIIFDECFNKFDYKTERIILEKIKKNYDVTIIFISHRKNNIDLFDKYYKLDNKILKIIKEV